MTALSVSVCRLFALSPGFPALGAQFAVHRPGNGLGATSGVPLLSKLRFGSCRAHHSSAGASR